MKKFVITIAMMMLLGSVPSVSMASQPAGHVWFSNAVVSTGKEKLNLGAFNAPVYGIAGHVALDRLAGESALDNQLEIAGVRLLIMYCNTPVEKQGEFVENAFWGLLPDIIDKCFNTQFFHPAFIEPPIVPLTKGATDLLEEIAVLSYTVKF